MVRPINCQFVAVYEIKKPTRPKTDVDAPIAKLSGLRRQESNIPPIPVTKYKNAILQAPIPCSIPFPRNSYAHTLAII